MAQREDTYLFTKHLPNISGHRILVTSHKLMFLAKHFGRCCPGAVSSPFPKLRGKAKRPSTVLRSTQQHS